ncbi:MAG TPA: DNA primase [Candidatus Paceibacterota bacterium]
MSDTVQQIKDRLSITDVVSQYVKLERAGSTLRARCPFHAEKTPSFFVSPERGTYHCFGCNVGGDIFSFVEQIEGLDFKGALKILAEKAGVEIVYRGKGESREGRDERDRLFALMETAAIFYASRLSDGARSYLQGRGVEDATVHAFRIGWAGNEWSEASDYLKGKRFTDKEMIDAGIAKKNERGNLTDKFRNRIMFPIADSAGRVVAFSGRIFGEHASPEAPKYLNSPETQLYHKSRILYAFDRAKMAIRKAACAVLVEGQMDLIMSHQAGWTNTVAVSGTAFTQEHAALIRRMTDNLVLALDADQAGIKAAGRAARVALQGGLNVKVAQLPENMDPADLIAKRGIDAWKTAIREAKDIITFLLDVLEKHLPAQAGAQHSDRFRRAVETVVLPFVVDVGSPIAREQYMRQIAGRLGVSESAVAEALKRVPTESLTTGTKGMVAPPESGTTTLKGLDRVQPSFAKGFERTRHGYALLLLQTSMPKPDIDIVQYARELEVAIGKEAFKALEALSESEKEVLRFSAERLYSASKNVVRDAHELVKILHEERLRRELAEVVKLQQKAERAGGKAELATLEKRSKVLIAKIAQLHGKG